MEIKKKYVNHISMITADQVDQVFPYHSISDERLLEVVTKHVENMLAELFLSNENEISPG